MAQLQGRFITAFFGLLLLASCTQEDSFIYADVDPEASCVTAFDNPICVLKTWLACDYINEAHPCDVLNVAASERAPHVGQVPMNYDPIVRNAPWTLPLSKIVKEYGYAFAAEDFNLVGVRLVDADRFSCNGTSLNAQFVGTHEVMFHHSDVEFYNTFYWSVFLRKTENSWAVIGTRQWIDNEHSPNMSCNPVMDSYERKVGHMYLEVEAWPSGYIKRKPQWTLPQ